MIKKPLKVIFAILMCISMVFTFMPMSIYSWADDTVVSESTNEDIVQEVDSTEKGIEESVTETPTVEEDTSAQEGGEQASKDKEAPVAKTEVKTEEALSSNQPTEAVTKVKMKTAAVDDSTPNYDVQGSKKASPTTLGSDRKTTVTLEMPSGEYQNKIDIVFVMDNSTSVANAGLKFHENAGELFEKIVDQNPGVELKVGVVKFRGYATDMLGTGLTKYTSDSASTITGAIANTSVPGSGSNIHSGMVMAEKLLTDDAEVEDSNKYVILLTDCKSYIWNNASNEPTTYYAQDARRTTLQKSGKPNLNQWNGVYNKESGQIYTTMPMITDHTPFNVLPELETYSATGLENASDYYQKLYDSSNSELKSTSTKYDSPAYYSKYYPAGSYSGNVSEGDGNVTTRNLTNGATIFRENAQAVYRKYYDYTPDPSTFWADVNYLQLNPYAVIQNEDGTYSYDTDTVNEDFWMWHPSALEKGIYQAGHFWKEKLDFKYNTACVATYKSADGAGSHICGSFRTWLFENSDMHADVNNSDDVAQLFTDIDNSIRYMVGSGVVTDKITDEFELDTSAGGCPFKMTKDGESIAASSSGDNSWNFGTAIDGVYPYVVEYDASSKTIKWTINVPIENLKKITLSYGLILGEEYPSGTYDTNKSAVLEYTSTDGKYQGEYEFEKPKVTYNKAVDYTLTINYVYANGGTAAKTYTTTLKAGASYGPINSPTIKGYKADRTSVSGVMPEHNVTLRVVYSAIPNDNDDDDDDDDDNPGGGNPGGPGVVPGGPIAATTAVPDTPTPTTNPPATTIDDPAPPLAEGAWALINLISAILTTLGAIIALFRRKEEEDEEDDDEQPRNNTEDEEEEEDNRGKKMLAAKIVGALAGIAAPITFILTEDMSLPMIMVDKWTILMLIMLAVQIVAAIANKKASELDDEDEEEEPETV